MYYFNKKCKFSVNVFVRLNESIVLNLTQYLKLNSCLIWNGFCPE